jgi:hypothetical protein
MNKLLITLIFIGFAFSVKSQTINENTANNFTYNQEGLLPKFVVVNVDSMTQAELFEKTINWIKETYKNPDEVIKTTIANQKVRFEGYASKLICINSLGSAVCYGGTYTIEVELKDGKYRFIPVSMSYTAPSPTGGVRDYIIPFDSGENWYNKGEIRKMWKTIPSDVESLLNGLNDSLFKYVSSQTEMSKDDWL